eukprot:GHVP01021312.1.p1 GENE.GHVP01021312.1~~GHVP01021312.1.p1  ORF type:complete len:228 (+),score=33.03 GHVP01021312.1:1376-2059(+)
MVLAQIINNFPQSTREKLSQILIYEVDPSSFLIHSMARGAIKQNREVIICLFRDIKTRHERIFDDESIFSNKTKPVFLDLGSEDIESIRYKITSTMNRIQKNTLVLIDDISFPSKIGYPTRVVLGILTILQERIMATESSLVISTSTLNCSRSNGSLVSAYQFKKSFQMITTQPILGESNQKVHGKISMTPGGADHLFPDNVSVETYLYTHTDKGTAFHSAISPDTL